MPRFSSYPSGWTFGTIAGSVSIAIAPASVSSLLTRKITGRCPGSLAGGPTTWRRTRRAIGISAIRTPVRSPKANAFAERWARTVREDCLDHLLIYSMCHLQAVLADYVRHYNEARPHRGRQLAPPLLRHDQPRTGEICRRDIFGGIHEYDRAA